MGEYDHKLAKAFQTAKQTVHDSFLDNFSTKEAMLALMKVINEANAYLRLPDVKPSVLLLRAIATYVTQILKIFGVTAGSDSFGFGSGGAESAESTGSGSESYID